MQKKSLGRVSFQVERFARLMCAVKRLFIVPQTKKSFVPQIREAEIVGLETIAKHCLDAFMAMVGARTSNRSSLSFDYAFLGNISIHHKLSVHTSTL